MPREFRAPPLGIKTKSLVWFYEEQTPLNYTVKSGKSNIYWTALALLSGINCQGLLGEVNIGGTISRVVGLHSVALHVALGQWQFFLYRSGATQRDYSTAHSNSWIQAAEKIMPETESTFKIVRIQITWRFVLLQALLSSFLGFLPSLSQRCQKMHKSICILLSIQSLGVIHLFTGPNSESCNPNPPHDKKVADLV